MNIKDIFKMVKTEWLYRLFEEIDKKDLDSYLNFLSEDVKFRFGNSPEVIGKHKLRETLDGFFKSIKGLKHDILKILQEDETIVCQGNVTYTRHDMSKITIPFMNYFEMNENFIKEYLIYIDISPLYS